MKNFFFFFTVLFGLVTFVSANNLDNAVQWMNDNGLTVYDNATDFKADRGLRRDEAAKFFVQFAKLLGKTDYVKTNSQCKFSDINQSWSDLKDIVVESCKLGLFQGSNGKFTPQNQLTNAQSVAVLVRLIVGMQSEAGVGNRSDNYYKKANELNLLKNVSMNSKNSIATRGNVGIIIYNGNEVTNENISNNTNNVILNEKKSEKCNEKEYKMAFVLVQNKDNPSTNIDINKINVLKEGLSKRFSLATRNMATLDTKDNIVVLSLEDILSLENNPSISSVFEIKEEITKYFYKTNEDKYDFITIFSTYESIGLNQIHVDTKNYIKGIGKGIYNNTSTYGSKGKLRGINFMANIDQYVIEGFRLAWGINGIFHEMSHQRGAGNIDFIDENGKESNALLNPYNMNHWDKKLDTNLENYTDTLGGFFWQDNGNGTFTVKETDSTDSYSEIDLYLMGLLPKEDVKPLKLIVSDADTFGLKYGDTISGYIKQITIDQIIKAEGDRVCIKN